MVERRRGRKVLEIQGMNWRLGRNHDDMKNTKDLSRL